MLTKPANSCLASLAPAACALLVFTAAALPAQAENLFVNGSFESPGSGYVSLGTGSGFIAGWTTVLFGVEYYSAGASAADGTMVVDLANYVYTGGGLEQAVATVAGRTYDVSFFAGNTRSSDRDGTGIVKVTIDGGDTLQFTTAAAPTAAYAWAQRSFSFMAQDSSTVIRFWNDQDPFAHFAIIDGVGIAQAVPEPQAAALMLAGLLGGAALWRRRAVA